MLRFFIFFPMVFGFMRSGDKGTLAKRVEQVEQRNASQRFVSEDTITLMDFSLTCNNGLI